MLSAQLDNIYKQVLSDVAMIIIHQCVISPASAGMLFPQVPTPFFGVPGVLTQPEGP